MMMIEQQTLELEVFAVVIYIFNLALLLWCILAQNDWLQALMGC